MANRSAKQMTHRRELVAVVVGLCLIALVVAGVLLTRNRGEADKVSDGPGAGSSDYGVTLGDPDAPHTVIFYEDFLCPYCGDLDLATRDPLRQLAQEGKVFVEYRPFWWLQSYEYSGHALNAWATVMEQSGPEVGLAFHDALFDNQPDEAGPSPTLEDILDLAVESGADRDAVSEDVLNMTQADFISGSTQQALDAGVQGTPWVVLDGTYFGDGTTVQEVADNLIARISGEPTPSG